MNSRLLYTKVKVLLRLLQVALFLDLFPFFLVVRHECFATIQLYQFSVNARQQVIDDSKVKVGLLEYVDWCGLPGALVVLWLYFWHSGHSIWHPDQSTANV